MSTRTRFAAAVLLTAAFVVTGCGGSGDDSSSGGGSAEADNAAPAQPPADGSQTDQGRKAAQPQQPQPGSSAPEQPSLDRAIIRTGYLTLESGDVSKARDRVSAIATSFQGQIATEETGTDDESRVDHANLVLRIPTASYERAMTALRGEDVGKVKQIRQESSDVTEQVVDVNSRIATQRAGLARMRVLASKATIGELITIETELTRREADLESLLAKQKALAAQTDLATITVTVVRPGEAPPPVEDRSGFLGGLSAGWDAFSATASALATAAGLLLPFSAAAALVCVPAWVIYRRQRRTTTPTAP